MTGLYNGHMLYLELVPRDISVFLEEVKMIRSDFSLIDGFNVPDILRLSNRSHDVVHRLLKEDVSSLPHLRAIDRTVEETISMIDPLVKAGLKSVLIVSGDRHEDRPQYDVPVTELIAAVKKHYSNLTVYAAIDPYRQSFDEECRYIDQKIKSGADGFFTQPFFNVSEADRYCDYLRSVPVFIGSSPVLTEKSKQYWETVNKVQFGLDFSLEFDANIQLARDLYQLSLSYQQHFYLMPIRINLMDYLSHFFKGMLYDQAWFNDLIYNFSNLLFILSLYL